MKIEKEFKVFGNIEDLMSLLEANSFNISHYVMHSNMHFTYNGKTVKLRIEYDINKEGFGVKFYKIIKEDINSKDIIKPKAETSTRLTPEEFITEFNKFSKKVKGKNIVFYTLLKNRLKSSLKSYKGITVDVCYFQNRPVDIAEYDLEDTITAYPDLMQFINKINKSAEKLFLAQPYIEIESLSKNMTTSKLIKLANKEIFHECDLFVSDKSAATLAKIFHGQYNALRIKSDEEIQDKKIKKHKDKKTQCKNECEKCSEDTSLLKQVINDKFGVGNAEEFKDRGVTLPSDSDGDDLCAEYTTTELPPINKYLESPFFTYKNLRNMINHDDLYVALGDKGIIYTSKDFLFWNMYNFGNDVEFKNLYYKMGVFIAVSDTIIAVSTDGKNWLKYNKGTPMEFGNLYDSKATQNIIRSPHLENETPIRYGKIIAIDDELMKKFNKSDLVKSLKFAGMIDQDISDDETFIIGNNLLVLGIK